MRTPKLAAFELRKFARGRLPRAAMAALVLLPLLYGALYLWSFWDPYSRLDKIPVALVVEDRGATADGARITAGADLAAKLRDTATFDWQRTDAASARRGLENGRYYLTLTVPADFSARLASSSGPQPVTSALQVRTNDANNYIVGQISRSVFSEVRAAASASASRGYYDHVFVSFADLHDKTLQAANGADRVTSGAGSAEQGAKDLGSGIARAESGARQLSTGLTQAHTGSGTLATGLDSLDSGASQVAAGTQRLADAVNGASDQLAFVKAHTKEIGDTATLVADGAHTVRTHLADIARLAPGAARDSRTAADYLKGQYDKQCAAGAPAAPAAPPSPTATAGTAPPAPAPDLCAALKKGADLAADAARATGQLNDAVGADPRALTRLTDDLATLERYARQLAAEAPHLGTDIDTAVTDVNTLNSGAHQVATGAHTAAGGARTLHKGLGTLSSGADSLSGGMYQLSDGSNRLTTGLTSLTDGSAQLAGGLHDGVGRIPDYDSSQRAARSSVMADPVQLASRALHKADTYGEGLAPYFIPLALWVGAMVAYMLFAPLNRRALSAGAPAWRIAVAGWLPAAATGAVQVVALLAVLHWALGLEMLRTAGTVGFLLLTTACFAAIVQLLCARFGPAGRVLVLALLMLQLTSAGGTYPVQTSPGFFTALHPLLPMSYVVGGLRRLITGGSLVPVWQGCAVLLAYTAGALLLTAFTARRKQVVTVSALHPELTL
ncbi:YhgE/Pip domain-containing protein [Streptomyces sp. NPDC051976]|uniref:YhgE/Pip domain-containing protein n=1 Tax=Streptomyces sp. NPDC051976 TaxID=3154947 RepID=UPI00341AA60F